MSCTNCFNGCVETTSDKCVKYTGNDITFLNIHTGDTLESVEKAITDYLTSVLSGKGIFPVIDSQCDIVSNYFPCEGCGDLTVVDILTAIIKALCEVETLLATETDRIDVIEGTYDVGDCLSVDPDAGTHTVLEATITELCVAIEDIQTLESLYATCITTGTIYTYIQNYLNTQSTSNYMYTKMVPNVVYPFWPTSKMLESFSGTGVGSGLWTNVYLCNGQNTTPDLRGRSLIGVVSYMGTGDYDEEIDPSTLGNKDYELNNTNGKNLVVLEADELAAHTHIATVHIDDPGHLTTIEYQETADPCGTTSNDTPIGAINNKPIGYLTETLSNTTSTSVDLTGLDNSNVTVSNAANIGGMGHSNVHPVYAVYYIIYLP